MNLFGLGYQELAVILVAALIFLGPSRLPEVAGQMGKAVRDLRRMTSDLTGELERTAGVGDIKKAVQTELAGVQKQVNSVKTGVEREMGGAAKAVNSSVASAASAAKGTGKSTTSSTSTVAKAGTTTSTTSKTAAKPAPLKATKKDPLADVSGMDDNAPVTIPSSAPAKQVAAAAAPAADTLDAISRARLRRQAAGYNRHPA
jgi:sec-independent protein translocase protein TatB